VQLLLSQHPSIATAPETQIFAYYLVHFEKQWLHEHHNSGNGQGRAGLSRVLDEAEFLELCRSTARQVLDKIRSKRPESELVVEKSPKHALQADFIGKVFPDAYFLNVIRDPRDTSASLMAASRSWASSWAPPNAVRAARMWVSHIDAGRKVAGSGRYREVLYEQLKADPVGELTALLAWVGVTADRAACEAAVAACDFDALRERQDSGDLPLPGSRSPDGFFRRGETGGWKNDLSPGDVRIIEHLCGPLMAELGYTRTTRAGSRPLRIALHDGLQRARESIDWQLQRLLTRL
jgi:hypothetical protein